MAHRRLNHWSHTGTDKTPAMDSLAWHRVDAWHADLDSPCRLWIEQYYSLSVLDDDGRILWAIVWEDDHGAESDKTGWEANKLGTSSYTKHRKSISASSGLLAWLVALSWEEAEDFQLSF